MTSLEYVKQIGLSTPLYPAPSGSDNNIYYVYTLSYLMNKFRPMYHFTQVSYEKVDIIEQVHEPGIEYN